MSSTPYSERLLNELKAAQKSDVEQVAKYKALMMELDNIIQERASLVRLLEAALNPEKRNQTVGDAINNRL